MNAIVRLLKTDFGRFAISVILGLGLATLFRKVCKNRNCLIFHPPPVDEVKNNIYKYGDKCHKFTEKIEPCDKKKKQVVFA